MSVFAFWLVAAPVLAVSALPAVPEGQAVPIIQAPRDGRTSAPDRTGSASVSGTVSVGGTGQPARKARVSLSGNDLRGGRTVTTDDMGRFVFASLPAGRYSLSASKPGHVTVRYGQRHPGPGRPGTPIQIAEGQQFEAHLQIPRGGVITGTVLDEHGEAVPGTSVRVLRYAMQEGQARLQQAGGDSTDDRGIYRVYGLQPGNYIVAATPRNAGNAMRFEVPGGGRETIQARTVVLERVEAALARAAEAGRTAGAIGAAPLDEEDSSGYAAVYYPGSTSVGGAAMVSVAISEEKTAIDFSLQLVPIARIEGVVVPASGQPAPRSIRVSLVNLEQNVPGIRAGSARPDRSGSFRISNVAPGRYMLVARGSIAGPGRGGRGAAERAQATQLWAMTEVSVDGRNISNIVLSLRPGMNISGRLVFEGVSTMPADLSRVRVTASPDVTVSRQMASSASARADASGRFTISGVVPGRYRISAAGTTQGWTLASAVVSGQDTLDFPVDVKPDEDLSGAVLTFIDRTSEITGTTVNERGEPAADYTVIVFPAEQHFRTPRSRRIASQRPGTDGRFTFRNLPPGEYLVTTLLDPEPGSWYDPTLLLQLENDALRVPLGAGESKIQNLRVGG